MVPLVICAAPLKIKIGELSMNRMHRVVWGECRKAFIVAGENAKAKGKPSSSTTGTDNNEMPSAKHTLGLHIKQVTRTASLLLVVGLLQAPNAEAEGPAVSAINGELSAKTGGVNGTNANLLGGVITAPIGHSFGVQLDGFSRQFFEKLAHAVKPAKK
jgi:hypothetical protein